MAVWCRNLRADPPLRYHLDMGTQAAISVATLAWAAICPRGYVEWRTWILMAARLAVYLPKSSRKLVGTPIALQRPADPRALGVLADGWRLMLGEPACLPACFPVHPHPKRCGHDAPQAREYFWCCWEGWCCLSGSPCSWWYTQRRSG